MGVSAISFTNGEDTDKASHRIMKKNTLQLQIARIQSHGKSRNSVILVEKNETQHINSGEAIVRPSHKSVNITTSSQQVSVRPLRINSQQ